MARRGNGEGGRIVSAPRGIVVFDLDGTLVDSAPDLADALDDLLNEKGLAPLGLDVTRALIGHGIDNLVRQGLARRGVMVAGDELRPLADRFRTIYAAGLSRRTRPYEAVEPSLEFSPARVGGLPSAPTSSSPMPARSSRIWASSPASQ